MTYRIPTIQIKKKEFAEYFAKKDKDGNIKLPSDTTIYRWLKEAGYKTDKNNSSIIPLE